MKHVRGTRFVPLLTGSGFSGGFLGLSGLLCSLMVILDLPELIIGLKNTTKIS